MYYLYFYNGNNLLMVNVFRSGKILKMPAKWAQLPFQRSGSGGNFEFVLNCLI